MHPTLLHLGPLVLPTFGALLGGGLMLALALSLRTARLAGVSPDRLWNAGLFAIIAAFVLSRGLLVAANWQAFLHFPLLLLAVPSLTAGGLVLTLAATLVWLWARAVPPLHALEAWTPPGLLVWGFLALGHFAEGSDPGMPTASRWGVRFPGDAIAQMPVPLFVAAGAFALALLSYGPLRRGLPAAGPGLIGAGVLQVLLSFVRQPGSSFPGGLEPLEWVGLGLIAAGGLLLAGGSKQSATPA